MKERRILKVMTLVENRFVEELYAEEARPQRHSIKKVWFIAAIVALAVLLMGSAYVLLNMDDLRLRDDRYPTEEMEGEFAMISLQGFAGTPNYQAAQEWLDFKASYDPEGEIMQSLTYKEMVMPEEYLSYNCYTPEMTAKVDEICEKYGLNKQGPLVTGKTLKQFNKALGIEGILRDGAEAEVKLNPQYYYKTGTFMLHGEAKLTGENSPWNESIEYQFYSVMKTDFDAVFLNVGDIQTYDQWEYITWNGMQVLLAKSPNKALVFVDNGTAFITVNILNPRVEDAVGGEQMISWEALEAFADTFDFSFVPHPVAE